MAPLQAQAQGTNQAAMQHFTHPQHSLYKVYVPTDYNCDGCNTPGFGARYRCAAACDFDLHEQCATSPATVPSHVHPQHQLSLVNQPAGCGRFCDLCRGLVNGLHYTCLACDFDAHPLCTQLPSSVQHALHPQHPLRLQPGKPSWCGACRRVCSSWRYRCDTCGVDVHLECVSVSAVPPPVMWVPPAPAVAAGSYINGGCNSVGVPSTPGFGINQLQLNQAQAGGGGQVNGSSTDAGNKKMYSLMGNLALAMVGIPPGLFKK